MVLLWFTLGSFPDKINQALPWLQRPFQPKVNNLGLYRFIPLIYPTSTIDPRQGRFTVLLRDIQSSKRGN